MKWHELLDIVGDEPFFRSGMLLAGDARPDQVRVQLARWVRGGKLRMLARGLYTLAPPWRKRDPHPFELANALRPGSYVSLQSAMAYHGIIPEHVPVVMSVGPGRPGILHTSEGVFAFRWLHPALRFGYLEEQVAHDRTAFVGSAEKALLDIVHLTHGGDSEACLRELRLDDHGVLNADLLSDFAERTGRAKLIRAARRLRRLMRGAMGTSEC